MSNGATQLKQWSKNNLMFSLYIYFFPSLYKMRVGVYIKNIISATFKAFFLVPSSVFLRHCDKKFTNDSRLIRLMTTSLNDFFIIF